MNPVAKTSNYVNLTETVKNGKSFLQFDFNGYFDHPSALKAIEEWKKKMNPDSKIDLIFKCTEMTGFDSEARKIWQATLSTSKSLIGNIWIISSNSFILAAAKTMGLLAGYTVKVAKTINDIKD